MTMTVLNATTDDAQSLRGDAAGNLLVALGSGASSSVATGVTPTNKGSTIAVAATSQLFAAANANRKGIWIRNNSASSLYLEDVLAAAVTTGASLEIKAGEYVELPYVTTGAYYIIGPVAGQSFSAREW